MKPWLYSCFIQLYYKLDGLTSETLGANWTWFLGQKKKIGSSRDPREANEGGRFLIFPKKIKLMHPTVEASTIMASRFLRPHYSFSDVVSHTTRSMSSNEEARSDSKQHGAARVRVQTQFSILKLNVNVWKKPLLQPGFISVFCHFRIKNEVIFKF